MIKFSRSYVCQQCGASYSKWLGRCESCDNWNTLTEESSLSSSKRKLNGEEVEFQSLEEVSSSVVFERISTQNVEFDRVCGAGLVSGSIILVGGEPGIGKSTLLLQIAAYLSQNHQTFYTSGEESLSQIQLRAQRLGVEKSSVKLASNTNVYQILNALKNIPRKSFIIIDSIQTMYLDSIESSPGSLSQVRACAHELQKYAKKNDCTLILVGHVTKEGNIAGPKVLEHMVDTVLYFEGERTQNYRILRSVKNRFGATDEIGVFTMLENGLQCVKNPSSFFIKNSDQNISGTTISATIEGTRPILVEIQALVSSTYFAVPKRTTVGWDNNRLSMILAVLQSRCGYSFHNKDVYINIGGGLKISEPSADLAVAASLISSLLNKPVPQKSIFLGEIGLTGQVRPVFHLSQRLKEARKLGFLHAYYSSEKNNENITNHNNHIVNHLSYFKTLFQ